MKRPNLVPITLCCAASLFAAAASAAEGVIHRDHGLDLHYTVEGSGTPLVFLSGGPGLEVDYMREPAAMFPAGFSRVFLEQRGTGRSRSAAKMDASNLSLQLVIDDLEALRVDLKQERLNLIGHSWGAMLSMAYAAKYPDKVDRMILIGPGGPTLEFSRRFSDTIQSRLHAEDLELRQYWRDLGRRGAVERDKASTESMKANLPGYFYDRAKALTYAASMKGIALRQDAASILQADLAKNYDVREGLRAVRRPALILLGHQDPTGDLTAEEIRNLIAGSKVVYLDQCGHFPWVEQPEAFRKSIADFLAR